MKYQDFIKIPNHLIKKSILIVKHVYYNKKILFNRLLSEIDKLSILSFSLLLNQIKLRIILFPRLARLKILTSGHLFRNTDFFKGRDDHFAHHIGQGKALPVVDGD